MNRTPADSGSAPREQDPVYRCGPLVYTKLGLVALFAWLLWGDFCYTVMEAVAPSVVPLKLKSLGCSNLLMGLILTTIPSLFNMTVCPYVSFKSDRYRSKWGRRIPFIAATMPFLCACLVLMGWSEDLGRWLQGAVPGLRSVAPATLAIGLIGVFSTLFAFFNMYVASVFWYLFNDVVPPQFLARFVGLFRVVGVSAGALYNYFIFQFAESHMREILTGGALLYLVGFTLVCVMVKEGPYPPLEEAKSGVSGRSWIHGIRAFVSESFTNRFYLLVYGTTAAQTASGCILVFDVFFKREMGLTLEQIGTLAAVAGGASLVAAYFSAVFIDRWHPLRVSVYMSVLSVAGAVMNWVWLFVSLPGPVFFWMTMGISVVSGFQLAMLAGAAFPRDMRVFPQSRFGQFCSAQAAFRSLFVLLAGLVTGALMDLFKWLHGGSDFAYRYLFVWLTGMGVVTAAISLLMYRKWYELGGDAHFHPPAPWSQNGVEDLPLVATVGPSARWVGIGLTLWRAIMALSVVALLPLMVALYRRGMERAFFWHGVALLPGSVAIWGLWSYLEKAIRGDMRRSRAGEPLRNGLPHHGCVMVIALQFLLLIPIWLAQMGFTIMRHMEREAIVFTAGNMLTNLCLIGSLWIIVRVERNRLTRMDCMLAGA